MKKNSTGNSGGIQNCFCECLLSRNQDTFNNQPVTFSDLMRSLSHERSGKKYSQKNNWSKNYHLATFLKNVHIRARFQTESFYRVIGTFTNFTSGVPDINVIIL